MVEVEEIKLIEEVEKHAAYAKVRIGDVLIEGIAIYKTPGGRLYVHFPRYKSGPVWTDAIVLPANLRTKVERDIISAYKQRQDVADQSKASSETKALNESHARSSWEQQVGLPKKGRY